MIDFLKLLVHVVVCPFKTQARLEAEIVILRHQLNVLRRRVPSKPKLAVADRLLFVWLYRLLRGWTLAEALAVVCLSNAVFLLVSSAVRGELVWEWSELASVVSLSSLVDLIEVVLLVWLLREMMPVRFAARCLVIPLLTLLEGYGLMRPELTVRVISGMVLLAAGGGMLLFLKAGEEETVLSLR